MCAKFIHMIFQQPDRNVVIVRSRNSIVKLLVSLKEETPLSNKIIYYLVKQIWADFVILQLRFPLFWLAISKIITESVISEHMDRS